ncbi:MAG: Nif3-like dinuclear metal center hexameric protein [Clostridia bacterium]|nr:Nif3-like dinuclear metal center hexameric protein [Clostridia bacterium]
MTKVSDVVSAMEDFAPLHLAEEWDNSGFLIGDEEREVKKIAVMLDLDKNTLTEALNVGADMIVTHHPIIMSGISSITNPIYLKLIENKISVYCAHTSLDSADEGVNDVLARKIGLDNVEKIAFGTFNAKGGTVQNCSFSKLIEMVKHRLGIKSVRYVGEKETEICKVCVIGGSGGDFITDVKESGFDALVTADIKYHQAQTADSIGLCVIDAGHFETENPVIYKIAEYLHGLYKDIEIITSLRNKSYIKYE